MAADPQSNAPAGAAQIEEQLNLYAAELHALYQEEREERERLAEEKLVLEYRLKELSALNTLFQQSLQHQQRLEDVAREVAARLRKVLSRRLGPESRRQLEQMLALAEQALGAGPAAARPAPEQKGTP